MRELHFEPAAAARGRPAGLARLPPRAALRPRASRGDAAPARLPGSAGPGAEGPARRGAGGGVAPAGSLRRHSQEPHGAPSLAGEEGRQARHRAPGQRELRGRRAVRDLNFDLLQLQRGAGADGSHATRRDRSYALAQMANALHEAGYRGLRAKGLKGKHGRGAGAPLAGPEPVRRHHHEPHGAPSLVGGPGRQVEPGRVERALRHRAALARLRRHEAPATSTRRSSRG